MYKHGIIEDVIDETDEVKYFNDENDDETKSNQTVINPSELEYLTASKPADSEPYLRPKGMGKKDFLVY